MVLMDEVTALWSVVKGAGGTFRVVEIGGFGDL